MTLGFIIIRHVNSSVTNEYWAESLRCIKKWYPDCPVMIVDDNSNPNFLHESESLDLTNVTVVQSEFHKRAELLPYYYFHKLKPFDKAVIIHDSVFIQKYVNFDNVNDVSFLWSFTHDWDVPESELDIISKLKSNNILRTIYNSKDIWLGCFGVMSCITHDFLSSIVDNYDMFDLLNYIDSRDKRMYLERIFAVMCYSLTDVQTIFGDINNYNGRYIGYQLYKNNELEGLPFVKVFTGR
jgi:hypothetical protein